MKVGLLTLLCSVSVLLGKAQQVQRMEIKGLVLNSTDRSPVSNANIRLINKQQVTRTDDKGKFVLNGIVDRDSLTVSSVGYHSRTVAGVYFRDNAVILLQREENYLQEVQVNTGYQTLRANEVTGAINVISRKMLDQQVGTNILQRLNNVVPAVRFDNQPIKNGMQQKLNVSVRGLSTINGNLDPLIVLDGFIYEGDITNIDPAMIESATVLKDAAASAIWGARAGNGVIVLTTKKGMIGANTRNKITFGSTMIFKDRPNLSQLYQVPNADFIAIEKMLFDGGHYDVFLQSFPYVAMTPVIDILDRTKNGKISSLDSAEAINNLLAQDGLKNYSDAFYRSPMSMQYNLHIAGGNAKNSYGLGLGYTKTTTELDSRNRKWNLLFSNSYRPIANLQVDLNVNYTDHRDQSGRPDYSSLSYGSKSVPYMQFFDNDGKEISFDGDFRRSYLDQNFGANYLDWSYYPLSEYNYSKTTKNLTELFASAGISYQILPYLKFTASGQYQKQASKSEFLSEIESYSARLLINKFTQVDPVTGKVSYPVPRAGINKIGESEGQSYTVRSQLNLDKRLGAHHLIGIFGAEMRQNTQGGADYTVYGYNSIPLTSQAVDFINLYRTSPDALLQTIGGSPDFTKTVNRFVSTYINFSDIWKEKYAISFSFRQDGANIFGANTNDKWSPLWSVGGFWDLGKEQFMELSWLDNLKLRATFGYSGNVDLTRTPEPIANIETARYTNYPMLNIRNLNDPSLRWEKVGTFNLGLDYALLKNRISGSVDYYVKNGKDLYGTTDYDYTTWGAQATVVKNVGAMRGHGLDLALNSINTINRFKWSTSLVLSLNKNKTTAYYRSVNQGLGNFLGNGNGITPIVGRPLNAIAAYRWAGLNEQGQPQGYLNGEVSTEYLKIRNASLQSASDSESIVFIGSSKPQLFGNFTNTFAWKTFSMSFNMSFKADYYFQKPSTSYYSLFEQGVAYPDFENRWMKPGDEKQTSMPKMEYPINDNLSTFYTQSEIHVLKGDHIRLEYINAAWEHRLPGKNEMKFRLYGNIANLGVIWRSNSQHIDPEFAYRLTPPKTFSLGIQIDY